MKQHIRYLHRALFGVSCLALVSCGPLGGLPGQKAKKSGDVSAVQALRDENEKIMADKANQGDADAQANSAGDETNAKGTGSDGSTASDPDSGLFPIVGVLKQVKCNNSSIKEGWLDYQLQRDGTSLFGGSMKITLINQIKYVKKQYSLSPDYLRSSTYSASGAKFEVTDAYVAVTSVDKTNKQAVLHFTPKPGADKVESTMYLDLSQKTITISRMIIESDVKEGFISQHVVLELAAP